MIPVRTSASGRACVIGLGRRGRVLAGALAAGGAPVTGWDEDEARRTEAARAGVVIEHPTTRDWGDLAVLAVDDAGLLADTDASGPLALARATGAPVWTELALFARALAGKPGARLVLAPGGGEAHAVSALAAWILTRSGLDARQGGWGAPLLDAPPLRAGSLTLVTASAAERASAPDLTPAALWLGPGSDASADEIAGLAARCDGPALIDMDAPGAGARLAALRKGGMARARLIVCSGRQTLGEGVCLIAGRLHDGRVNGTGRTWRAAGPGLQGLAPGLIAGAAGLALSVGADPDVMEEALASFPGAPGWRAPAGRIGPVRIIDYAAAQDPAAAFSAMHGPDPVFWIAGPGLDPSVLNAPLPEALAALILESPDPRLARRAGQRLTCRQGADIGDALARALHGAALSGGRAQLLYAPSTRCGPELVHERSAALRAALGRLAGRLRQGDAA